MIFLGDAARMAVSRWQGQPLSVGNAQRHDVRRFSLPAIESGIWWCSRYQLEYMTRGFPHDVDFIFSSSFRRFRFLCTRPAGLHFSPITAEPASLLQDKSPWTPDYRFLFTMMIDFSSSAAALISPRTPAPRFRREAPSAEPPAWSIPHAEGFPLAAPRRPFPELRSSFLRACWVPYPSEQAGSFPAHNTSLAHDFCLLDFSAI